MLLPIRLGSRTFRLVFARTLLLLKTSSSNLDHQLQPEQPSKQQQQQPQTTAPQGAAARPDVMLKVCMDPEGLTANVLEEMKIVRAIAPQALK